MRFKRSDLPGLLIATVAPAGLLLLILAGYELWDHHGTPLLPFISVNLAIAAGVLGVFSRFVRHWGLLGTLIGALLVVVAAGFVVHQTGNAGTTLDTVLRLVGAGLFVVINLVILREVLWYGLGPILDRRDERRARQAELESQ